MQHSDLTSASLLHSIRVDPRNPEVWQQFLKRYEPLIQHWCKSWELQDSDVNDVTQEVLLRLSKAMHSFTYDPSQSFRAWLKTVTQHAWIDWSKQVQKPGKGHGDTAILQLIHSTPAREDLSERLEAEYDEELKDLAMLRVRQRVQAPTWQAFSLTAIQGMSGREVARQLNMKVAHVYVAKSEILSALRYEIQQLETNNDLASDPPSLS